MTSRDPVIIIENKIRLEHSEFSEDKEQNSWGERGIEFNPSLVK